MNLLPSSRGVLDELSRMTAEDSNSSETREESSLQSSGSGDDTSRSRKGTAPGRIITADTTHIPTIITDLLEYEWPPNQLQADFYFIQEQLANLLSVKSFKRKYPNIRRRSIEGDEKKYLIEAHKLSELMASHLLNDLTALSADDVHDLLSKEYTEIYEEYQRICLARQKERQIKERLVETAESKAIKADPVKLNEMRKKAIQDAFEANRELQLKRKTERQFFFDSQTSIIQRPTKAPKLNEESKLSAYPVALNNFQFQEYYKVFKPEELRKLPMNTVLDPVDLFPPRREQSPMAIRVSDDELRRQEIAVAAFERSNRKDDSQPPSADTPKSSVRTSARRADKNAQRLCTSCRTGDEGEYLLDKLLKCCQCQSFIHARCAELSIEVTRVVVNYNWACIDCKNCSICKKADEENSMMFCDSCDRGFHTFCVGLDELPKGRMSTSSSGTTDINVKYQRLASEFVKLRSQVSVLKSGVVDEQERSARLQDELSEKATALRKFHDENEGLLFRNQQLVKRVELLQKSLDDTNKLQASKGKKKQKDANLRLFVDFADQPTNIPGTSTGTDRRQLFEQEFERQQIVISELESKISTIYEQQSKSMNELNSRIAGLEAENACLNQKLKEAEDLEIRKKNSVINNHHEVKLNGFIEHKNTNPFDEPSENEECAKEQLIDSMTAQISNEVPNKDSNVAPSTILSEHTKRLFDEANRSKAEYEGGIAALEHELEIMRKWRDIQTTAADLVDPETKSTEKCLSSFFREKIKQLTTDLRFTQGESAYYKDECDSLLVGTKNILENKFNEEASCSNCASLKEALDETRNTFEYQMRQMYEQLNEQESHLQEQKAQIDKLSGNPPQSRENSFKQNFRRMVGK